MIIVLREYLSNSAGSGSTQGRQVYEKISQLVENNPRLEIFGISLKGVEYVNISFARESLVALAKRYRKQKGFYLLDLTNPDLIDEWEAAADKLQQPLILWGGKEPRILGPEPNEGTREMLDYVLSVDVAYTTEAAEKLHLKIPNASNKLKKLYEDGYILRRERAAQSGGVEYIYYRIL